MEKYAFAYKYFQLFNPLIHVDIYFRPFLTTILFLRTRHLFTLKSRIVYSLFPLLPPIRPRTSGVHLSQIPNVLNHWDEFFTSMHRFGEIFFFITTVQKNIFFFTFLKTGHPRKSVCLKKISTFFLYFYFPLSVISSLAIFNRNILTILPNFFYRLSVKLLPELH